MSSSSRVSDSRQKTKPHAYIHTNAHTHIHRHTHTHTHAHTDIHTHTHTHTHIHTHTHTHTHIHRHTNTFRQAAISQDLFIYLLKISGTVFPNFFTILFNNDIVKISIWSVVW